MLRIIKTIRLKWQEITKPSTFFGGKIMGNGFIKISRNPDGSEGDDDPDLRVGEEIRRTIEYPPNK